MVGIIWRPQRTCAVQSVLEPRKLPKVVYDKAKAAMCELSAVIKQKIRLAGRVATLTESIAALRARRAPSGVAPFYASSSSKDWGAAAGAAETERAFAEAAAERLCADTARQAAANAETDIRLCIQAVKYARGLLAKNKGNAKQAMADSRNSRAQPEGAAQAPEPEGAIIVNASTENDRILIDALANGIATVMGDKSAGSRIGRTTPTTDFELMDLHVSSDQRVRADEASKQAEPQFRESVRDVILAMLSNQSVTYDAESDGVKKVNVGSGQGRDVSGDIADAASSAVGEPNFPFKPGSAAGQDIVFRCSCGWQRRTDWMGADNGAVPGGHYADWRRKYCKGTWVPKKGVGYFSFGTYQGLLVLRPVAVAVRAVGHVLCRFASGSRHRPPGIVAARIEGRAGRTLRDPPKFRWTPAHRSLEELVGTGPQELRDWLGNGWADYFARCGAASHALAGSVAEAVTAALKQHRKVLQFVPWAVLQVVVREQWGCDVEVSGPPCEQVLAYCASLGRCDGLSPNESTRRNQQDAIRRDEKGWLLVQPRGAMIDHVVIRCRSVFGWWHGVFFGGDAFSVGGKLVCVHDLEGGFFQLLSFYTASFSYGTVPWVGGARGSGASAEFDRIDADGDGVITRSEFVFDRLDRNHDGVISRAEFEAAVSSGQLAGSLADSREAAASSFGPATPSLAHTLQADRVAGPPFAEPLARPGSSHRLAAAPAGGPGAASGTPELVSRSQAEMTSRVGAATVHKLVGTTKNLLQGLEEALLLRAGFLAGAFHAWRCGSALRRASREAERRFQQHLARSQEEWSAQLEELRRKADADRQRGGTAAAQAIRLGIASRFFAGGARVMKKETWRTWRVYCRLEARKRTAVQNAELVFLQSSARGTLHVVLSTWQKEVSRQQLQRQAHRGQKELDEAKRMMQRQLGSQANQGVALVMKKFLGSSRTGALMSAWRAWQQAVAVAKAAAAKSRSACQVLHTLLNGNRHATLRAYFVNWRSEQAFSAVERAERVQLQAAQAEHEARLESVQVERQLQRAAAHKRVEQIIRKWVFGDRQGLLVWSVQEWCKVVESGRAAKRLKEVTCLTMVWALEGDRRGLLRGVVLSWRHEAQREAEASRRLREVEELQARMDSERRRREKELEASREEAARRMVKSEAVLKHMLERLFRGDMKATRSSAFREWRKMSAKSRMKVAEGFAVP
ncbi:unnamed protein product [Prorocentrum cordatum]|uniref:EF-hand domain-containing protein n=1 Tax=Prorocentrum cordatum TaxID=2364126 RepID=A0ABN9TFA5_9DINO|nr:unnamed protein product [Polarella glacialis]